MTAGQRPGTGYRTSLVALAAACLAPLALAAQPSQPAQSAQRTAARTPARATSVAADAVPVAARALPRGHVLAAEDIAPAPQSPPGSGSRSPVRGLVGWTTRRMVAAGEPLRAPAVAPPDAVRAGQPVAVVYRDAGLELRLAGTAAASAPVGQRVAVRVEHGGRTRRLEGTVVAAGVVAIR